MTMNIRCSLSILACKTLIKIGRLMGKKGSSTPGVIAMRIYPDVLREISSQIKEDIIFVCGTNGKTTTNNLLCSLIESNGKKVVCNKVGANMLPGIAVSFIEKATIGGKLDADFACIECDEASLRHAVKHVRADKVVVTNLFRDQLDRYGEIESTIALLKEALDNTENTTLILNGDDPMSATLGRGRNAVYFGINENCNVDVKSTGEGKFCTVCGAPLQYNFFHYSHLGDWKCSQCDFSRPHIDYGADNIDMNGKLAFDINSFTRLDVNYRGFYNIYNILASYTAYDMLNLKNRNINKVLGGYKPQIGRMEEFTVGGKQVILNLAKNPAGFNQAIATVMADKRTKDVLVAVNDAPSDGMDVSWLWDVDFEKLSDTGVSGISVSGERRLDVALRLKYAGFEDVDKIDINAQTLKTLAEGEGEVCYLLVNYTVLFGTQSILKTICDKGGC